MAKNYEEKLCILDGADEKNYEEKFCIPLRFEVFRAQPFEKLKLREVEFASFFFR